MKLLTFILALLITLTPCLAGSLPQGAAESWKEFAIWPTTDDQEAPDIDGDIVVWQQFVEEYQDYDIYIADLSTTLKAGINNPDDPLAVIIGDANDQMNPAVFAPFDSAQGEDLHAERRRGIVVWQDYIIEGGSGDWDILAADISERQQPVIFAVSNIFGNDEQFPAIHGNIVVWQDGAEGDYDIFGADITDLASPAEFVVAAFEYDQRRPAVYRNTVAWQDSFYGDEDILAADIWMRNKPAELGVTLEEFDQQRPAVWGDIVVWEDNYFGDMDIYAADISDPNNPIEFAITANEAEQTNPDIDRNIVVWQDNRNGNWDIYGYNLTTRQEFQITNNPHDQTNPAISGPFDSAQGEDLLHTERRRGTVVWEDNRDGNLQIYAIVLDGPEVAQCKSKLAGDINGDCKVDFDDQAIMLSQWLECNLEPEEACLPF